MRSHDRSELRIKGQSGEKSPGQCDRISGSLIHPGHVFSEMRLERSMYPEMEVLSERSQEKGYLAISALEVRPIREVCILM